jgi:hypothetical protein
MYIYKIHWVLEWYIYIFIYFYFFTWYWPKKIMRLFSQRKIKGLFYLIFVLRSVSLTKIDSIFQSWEVECQGIRSHWVIYSGRHESTFKDNALAWFYSIVKSFLILILFHCIIFILLLLFRIDIILFQQEFCAPSKIISNNSIMDGAVIQTSKFVSKQ